MCFKNNIACPCAPMKRSVTFSAHPRMTHRDTYTHMHCLRLALLNRYVPEADRSLDLVLLANGDLGVPTAPAWATSARVEPVTVNCALQQADPHCEYTVPRTAWHATAASNISLLHQPERSCRA
jgi:hypothetical protein